MDEKTPIPMQFTINQLNVMLEALGEVPFKKSAEIVNGIHEQVKAFMDMQNAKQEADKSQPQAEAKVVEASSIPAEQVH